jgi:uncharacterized membrane protein YbhN (UPF0104 family)
MATIETTRSSDTTRFGTRVAGRLAAAALLSVAVGSLLLAVPPLRSVTSQITRMHPAWILVAAALELASCLAYVVIFRLFFDELPAGAARELAWAETGSGALLPGGGIGALAIGGVLARRAGMSTRSIIDRSSALFFLTSAVNVTALIGAAAWLAAGGSAWSVRAGLPMIGGVLATGAVLAAARTVAGSPARAWPRWLIDLAAGITRALGSARRPSWRLLGAVGYLGFDIAALGAAFAAAGRPIAVAPLVLGYLIGYLANLVPIPGGFGVLEGGLAGCLIAYGAPATQAAAAVVVYHAIAFWIPSLGGLAGFGLLRRRLVTEPPMNRAARSGLRGMAAPEASLAAESA